jgi:DNA topoisomerase III, bacteria and conjugative plasmid
MNNNESIGNSTFPSTPHKLIVAEKPSVAGEIAKIVGATKNEKGYKTGNGYIVSWCFGHLIELSMPEEYGEQYKKWNVSVLPILPDTFKTAISRNTSEQFKILKELMNRNDVTELIEATDAGREGELIFRLVYEKASCKKPFKRLWISSMEEKSIRDGLANMKDGSFYDSLYYAARSRQRADWLYGINLTRLYTGMYNQNLNCGRVQTPTVNLIVQRHADITGFVSQTYYNVIANLKSFEAHTRVDTKEKAQSIADRCTGKDAVVTLVKREEKRENPPALYDLTTLQRDANRLLSYSAQQTLTLLQSLYEAKLTTYPRTDSRFITADMANSTKSLIEGMMETQIISDETLKRYNVRKIDVERVVNDDKVTDHHAVLPTQSLTKAAYDGLPTAERNIVTLVVYRLLTAVYSPYEYTATKVVLDCEGEAFEATGREIKESGFKEIDAALKAALATGKKQKDTKADKTEKVLPPMIEGKIYTIAQVRQEEKHTEPLKPYTEDTLLAAMETAGKNIADEELKEAMKDSGLGTPATRAGIIENIMNTGYVVRDGKKLLPTDKAITFMSLVVDKIKQPELTGEWEKQLAAIQKRQQTEAAFMKSITEFLRSFVGDTLTRHKPENTKDLFKKERTPKEVIAKCPKCGANVISITAKPKTPQDKPKKYYICEKDRSTCGFILGELIAGKKVTAAQAKKLLEKGKTDLINGFTSKAGKPFSAHLVLKSDFTTSFVFENKKMDSGGVPL